MNELPQEVGAIVGVGVGADVGIWVGVSVGDAVSTTVGCGVAGAKVGSGVGVQSLQQEHETKWQSAMNSVNPPNSQTCDGTSPLKLLFVTFKVASCDKLPISAGIFPPSSFLFTDKNTAPILKPSTLSGDSIQRNREQVQFKETENKSHGSTE